MAKQRQLMARQTAWLLMAAFALPLAQTVQAEQQGPPETLRARLVELKQLRDEGLIPPQVYDAEVAKVIALPDAPDQAPAVPARPQPIAEPVAPKPAPPADAAQPAEVIPAIDWGQLELFFTIGNVRKGIHKDKDWRGSIELYPALIFDVRAKETFSLATTLFLAVFLDKEGFEITRYPVEIEEKYKHLNWKPGMRGSGRIGLVGIELPQVAKIRIERGFSASF